MRNLFLLKFHAQINDFSLDIPYYSNFPYEAAIIKPFEFHEISVISNYFSTSKDLLFK